MIRIFVISLLYHLSSINALVVILNSGSKLVDSLMKMPLSNKIGQHNKWNMYPVMSSGDHVLVTLRKALKKTMISEWVAQSTRHQAHLLSPATRDPTPSAHITLSPRLWSMAVSLENLHQDERCNLNQSMAESAIDQVFNDVEPR